MSIFNACAPNQNKYSVGVPVGCILIWSGAADQLPEGYALCNGENGTPDLRGRFILGSNDSHPVGETGGEEKVALTSEQMPKHTHAYNVKIGSNSGYGGYLLSGSDADTVGNQSGPIRMSGGGAPHPNMPPYYALCYIMKL